MGLGFSLIDLTDLKGKSDEELQVDKSNSMKLLRQALVSGTYSEINLCTSVFEIILTEIVDRSLKKPGL